MKGIQFLEGHYSPTLDIYPVECKEFNRIYPFYDNLRAGRFTTTKCKDCGHTAYPPRVICPKCYSENLEWIDLPTQGKAIAVVEKWGGVPLCFTPPMIDAWIEFPKGSPVKHVVSRLVNCASGEVKEGDELKLAVYDIPAHPMDVGKDSVMVDRVYFAFEPVKKK